MFYETAKNNHGLPFNPFKSCIVPRPIGWISSQDSKGNLNLAPYSYFNALCDALPLVMFSSTDARADGSAKDTLKNVEETGEFVVNIATYALREQVSLSSAGFPSEVNEFEYAKLETAPSYC